VAAPEDPAAAAAVAQQAAAAAAKARKRKQQQVQQDIQPALVREALFHMKATLKGLANFKTLHSLCEEYAEARAGIFKPLMPLMAAAEAAAAGVEAAGRTKQRPSSSAAGPGSSGSRKRAAAAAADAPPAKAVKAGAAGRGREQQHPSSAPAAAGSEEGPAPPVAAPLELFDSAFAGSLQEFAATEAERVLDSLQPPTKGSRRRKAAANAAAAEEEEEEGAAPGGSKYYRWRKPVAAPYKMSVFGTAQAAPTAAAAAGRNKKGAAGVKGKALPSRSVPSHLRYFMDLAAAGVLNEADAAGGAAQVVREDFGLGSAAQRALLQQADRQQQILLAADTWFAAQDAMMAQQGRADDTDSDMPEV
jgi:hypothetical protein